MSVSRRSFLEKSALASSFFIVPRHVLGGKGFLAPSDKLIVAGIGVGFINPPLASTAVGVVPPQRAGMASGINSTFRQVGIAGYLARIKPRTDGPAVGVVVAA